MGSVVSPETMFIQPAPSREIFLGRLQTIGDIASSDNRNLLLNDQLEATEKWGLRWIVSVILTPICYLFCDLFYHERMNRVAQKLQEFLHVNQQYFPDANSLRDGITDVANRIIVPLKRKTHGNFDMVLNGILTESNNRLAGLERADVEGQRIAWQTTQAQQQEALEAQRLQLQQQQAALETQRLQLQQQQGAFQRQQAARQTTQAQQHEALERQRLQLQQQQGAFQAEQAAWQTTQAQEQEALETQRLQLQQQQGAFQAEQAAWQTTQAQEQEALETQRLQLQQQQGAFQAEQAAWQTTQAQKQEALETERLELEQQQGAFQAEQAAWQTTQAQEQEALETERLQLQQQGAFQPELAGWRLKQARRHEELEKQHRQLQEAREAFTLHQEELEERKQLEGLEQDINQAGSEIHDLLEQHNEMDGSEVQSEEEFQNKIDPFSLSLTGLNGYGFMSSFSPNSDETLSSLDGIDEETDLSTDQDVDSLTHEEADGKAKTTEELKEKIEGLSKKFREYNNKHFTYWKKLIVLVSQLKKLREVLSEQERQKQAISQSSSEESTGSFL